MKTSHCSITASVAIALSLVSVLAYAATPIRASTQNHSPGSFRAPTPRPSASVFPDERFPVGTSPIAIGVGDLDGDSDLDLVTGNFAGNSVSVLSNIGNGRFAPAVSYAWSSAPRAIAVEDLNGDGALDVAVVNYSSNQVSIRLNDGTGSFGALVSYTVGTNPTAISFGDVDGDLDLDVAVSNFTSNTVSVGRNDGDGTFDATPFTTYTAGTRPNGVALVDLDGDTDLDLAVANTISNNVTLRMNDGTGAFGAPTTSAAGTNPSSIAAADLDGDGDQDLVVTTFGENTCVAFLRNIGTGTFAAPFLQGPTNGSVSYARQLRIGDIDGDLDLDVVVVRSRDDGGVGAMSVLVNNGSGALASVATPICNGDPRGLALGDLDGDGDLDLAVAHYALSTVSAFENIGGGAYAGPSRASVTTTTSNVYGPNLFVDLDGDADLDVVATDRNSAGIAVTYENVGGGNFAAAVNHPVPALISLSAIAAGDLDGDSDVDLAATGQTNQLVILTHAGTSFTTTATYSFSTLPFDVALGDVDGDLDLDVIVTLRDAYFVSVLTNDGTGALSAPTNYGPGSGPGPTSGPRRILLSDLDGDLDLDIVVGAGAPGIWILTNDGSGTFTQPVEYAAGGYVGNLAIADFDGDGDPDVAAMLGTSVPGSTPLAFYFNYGDGTFAAPISSTYPKRLISIVAGDLDHDQRPDLVCDTDAGSVEVLRNIGAGAFAFRSSHGMASERSPLMIGDVDGDGYLDIGATGLAGESDTRKTLCILRNRGRR